MRHSLPASLSLLMLAACSFGGEPKVAASMAPSARAKPLTLEKTSAEGLAAMARKALSMGEVAAALPLARNAVAAAPEDLEARQLLAQVLLLSGEPVESESQFSALLVQKPGDAGLKTGHAMAMLAMGNAEAARAELAGVIAARPALAQLSDAAFALTMAGDPKAAADALAPVAFDPQASARLRQNYALALTLSGRRNAAYEVANHDLAPQQALATVNGWYALAEKPQSELLLAIAGIQSRPGSPGVAVALALLTSDTPQSQPIQPVSAQPLPVNPLPLLADALASPKAAPAADQSGTGPAPKPALKLAPLADDSTASNPSPIDLMPKLQAAAKPLKPSPRGLVVLSPSRSALPVQTVALASAPSPQRLATGNWAVQIAAVDLGLSGARLKARLAKEFGSLMDVLGEPFTRDVTVANKPVRRVFAGPYASRQDAQSKCKQLRARQHGCLVKSIIPASSDAKI